MANLKHVHPIPGSEGAYDELKSITDAAQDGVLSPWSPEVINIIGKYGVVVRRKADLQFQTNLSFPTSTINESMAIGIRHLKDSGDFTEDLFVFEKGIGLACYYRGAQEEVLPEYKGTHHAKVVLSEVLPDVQRELAEIKQKINKDSSDVGYPWIYVCDGAFHNWSDGQTAALDIQNSEQQEYFLEAIEIEGKSAKPSRSLKANDITRGISINGISTVFESANPLIKMTVSRGGNSYRLEQAIEAPKGADGLHHFARFIEKPVLVAK